MNTKLDALPVNPAFGFSVLQAKQLLKLQLDEGGQAGRASFLQACIASGIDDEDDLVSEVLDITGPQTEFQVRLLLAEGIGKLWQRARDGSFYALTDL